MIAEKEFKILLIEDNPGDARLIEIFLTEDQDYKFAISKAESLKEAFAYDKLAFDCILLDLSLPDSIGLETLQKGLNYFSETPIIVQTGLDDEQVGMQAVEKGAIDYLVKGDLNTRMLVKTISYAIIRSENENLVKAKALAERTANMKQRFLATMSHEMRTPLNVVKGMTDLLLTSEYLPEQKDYLDSLKISADNLLKVINDILDLSKIESDKIVLEKHRFGLKAFLQDLMQMYKYKTNQKGLQLFSQFDTNLPEFVIGDSVRLNQVLINLLDNAVKYTESGEITLRAMVVKKEDNHMIMEFGVKDSGIGIAEDKLDSIFDSFVQASDSTTRLYGGTGLGLSIARHLVDLFGGSFVVESEVNKGSFFKFTAKLEIDNSTVSPKETLQPSASTKDFNKDNFKILMVEDHELNQLVTGKLLQRWSSNVNYDIANNGQEGFEMVRNGNYDVVLMDISMPIMDGLEATKKIRSELPAPQKDIPIIAMTAHAFKSEIERCYNAGMDDFVSKPVDANKFFEALDNQLSSIIKGENNNNDSFESEDQGTVENEFDVDISYLDELSGGDKELTMELVSALIDDLPQELNKLKASFDLDKYEEYYKVAHKLKTSYAYVGMREDEEVIKVIIKPESGATFPFESKELISLIDRSEVIIEKLKKMVKQFA